MTPEDEAFEELDRKLNTKRIAKAMTNLNKELEIFRNEVIEEVASKLEAEFKTHSLKTPWHHLPSTSGR